MLDVRGLTMVFGSDPLFNKLSFSVSHRERVALLGPNGSGKSTLLAILAGTLRPTAGSVTIPSLVDVGYLPQVEWDDETRSAGQRQKGRLAGALGQRPGLLLLDEPTNHLDRDAIRWLTDELREYPGAVLFACHDRDVVEAVATRVLYLERGQLQSYVGAYQAFEAARAAEEAAQRHHHEAWRDERERLRASALRQRQWAEKAHHQAGERNPYGKKRAAKMMQKALAAEGRLARHEARRVEKPWEAAPLSFSFLPASSLPPVLVRCQDLAFTYEGKKRRAVGPVTFEVRRGERLLLDGGNGSGKTTLMRLMGAARDLHQPPPGRQEGRITVNPGARVALFDPATPLDPARTPVQHLMEQGAPDAALARTLLGHFAISGDLAVGPTAHLSPGEQMRLRCVMLLVSGPDLVLLDEPSNHLDREGRQALERALRQYPGTVVLASHDERFRREVATRRIAVSVRRPGEPTAPAPTAESESVLQMRLSSLIARLDTARGEERAGIEQAIEEVVALLRSR
jgi:ATPase subunit of ABC transporter with duplicated ATPase domains